MNSLILISPYKGSGFKPILSGKMRCRKIRRLQPLVDKQSRAVPTEESRGHSNRIDANPVYSYLSLAKISKLC
ncbi:hypothetical protein QUB68_28880 [Microcoleus sp. A006_D1]|uniref:hypothetical protein n=1 Tax=Microcoleus sp. A006_D1 TaxID=3055267 RepID=UPI002FD590B6